HDHLRSGDRPAERGRVRLLEPGYGGAADSLRRGSGQDADRAQWGLSPIRVQRPGARLDRQRQFQQRRGAAYDISRGTGNSAVQLFDHSRAPGASLAGERTGSFLYADQRNGFAGEPSQLAREGVREQPAAVYITRQEDSSGKVRAL